MYLKLPYITLTLVGIATAHPLADSNIKATLTSRAASQSYSCAGSSMCNRQANAILSWACNKALTKIDPKATYKTGGPARDTGVCANKPYEAFGCGIFVSGPKGCARTGAQMIQAVSDIRTQGKCIVCGWAVENTDSVHGECQVKIDYVSGC